VFYGIKGAHSDRCRASFVGTPFGRFRHCPPTVSAEFLFHVFFFCISQARRSLPRRHVSPRRDSNHFLLQASFPSSMVFLRDAVQAVKRVETKVPPLRRSFFVRAMPFLPSCCDFFLERELASLLAETRISRREAAALSVLDRRSKPDESCTPSASVVFL